MSNPGPPPYKIFNGKRIMPIIHVPYDGFLVFSSEQSYEKWECSKLRKNTITEGGLGIPLFHFQKRPSLIGLRSKPVYYIYKYIVQRCEEPPPCDKSELIVKNGVHCVYKIIFCSIYRNYCGNFVVYKLKFPFCFTYLEDYEFVNFCEQKGYCGLIEGFDLSWKLCDEKFEEYELWSDFQNVSQLVNRASTDAKGKQEQMKDAPPSVTALYSRRKCNPRDREANLIFLEQTPAINLGMTAVPALTEVLACHGMLIHSTQNKIREHEAQRMMKLNPTPSDQPITSLMLYSLGKGGDC